MDESEANAGKRRDYERICPLAECRAAGAGIELHAPVIGVCANAEKNEFFSGWRYSVVCKRYSRNVRGQTDDRAGAVSEMLFWLGSFGCPGRLSS